MFLLGNNGLLFLCWEWVPLIKYCFKISREQKIGKRPAGLCLNPISGAVPINMALSA